MAEEVGDMTWMWHNQRLLSILRPVSMSMNGGTRLGTGYDHDFPWILFHFHPIDPVAFRVTGGGPQSGLECFANFRGPTANLLIR